MGHQKCYSGVILLISEMDVNEFEDTLTEQIICGPVWLQVVHHVGYVCTSISLIPLPIDCDDDMAVNVLFSLSNNTET